MSVVVDVWIKMTIEVNPMSELYHATHWHLSRDITGYYSSLYSS